MKKGILLSLLTLVFLAGCSGSTSQESSSPTSSQGGTSTVVTYTVTLNVDGDTTLVEVEGGSSYSRPDDPTTDDQHMFDGWYLDSSYSTLASFPLTINSNITLYGTIISNEEYFLAARDRTVNGNYTYEDTLSVTTSVLGSGLGPTATRTGLIQSRPSDSFSYLAHYASSGALLFDGESYVMHRDEVRETIEINEDGELRDYEQGSIEDDESSTFAKAIFEYDDDDIESLTYVGNDTYTLETTMNASSVISSALNFFGSNSIVQAVISNLPDIVSNFEMKVTFDDGYIDTYIYTFSVTVGNNTVNFSYTLDFTSFEYSVLSAPSIDGLYLGSSQLNTPLTAMKNMLNAYKEQEVSKYEYTSALTVKGTNSYNFTSEGEATRKIFGDDIYFNNHIDFSTNLDDYYSSDVEEYEVNRANLLDGSVYSCTSSWLGISKTYDESTNRGEVDEYYLLLDEDFFVASNFNAIQETTNGYTLYLNSNAIASLLTLFNSHVYASAESNSVKVAGDFTASSISITDFSDATMNWTTSYGSLSSISVSLSDVTFNTTYNVSLTGAEITKFQYEIEVVSITDYTIPETTDQIDID